MITKAETSVACWNHRRWPHLPARSLPTSSPPSSNKSRQQPSPWPTHRRHGQRGVQLAALVMRHETAARAARRIDSSIVAVSGNSGRSRVVEKNVVVLNEHKNRSSTSVYALGTHSIDI